MSQSVLGLLTLHYQPVWDGLRNPVAVVLHVERIPALDGATVQPVDAAHLLGALAQVWSAQSPILILALRDRVLLSDLLRHGQPHGPWIAVHDAELRDPAMLAAAQAAHGRGVKLVWQGEAGRRPDEAVALHFVKCMLSDATPGGAASAAGQHTPDQIFHAVGSRVLAEHCLQERQAWGVAGWPAEDVLEGYRGQAIQASQRNLSTLFKLTDADAPLEVLEHGLDDDPVLVYRFLRHVQSAAMGRRDGVESLRHGLMLLGMSRFEQWLTEQMHNASDDLNLEPVRAAMVLRARIMEQLVDAGEEDKLRQAVYLCGLLSGMDRLLGEPLAAVLARVELPQPVVDALLKRSGTLAPYLALATALEHPATQPVQPLCAASGLDIGDVNRALLKVLAHAQSGPAWLASGFQHSRAFR